MVKSGLEKIFLKFLHGKPISSNSFYLLVLRKITNSATKITIFPHGGKSEIFFTICAWPNWHYGEKILPRCQFEGKTEVWISEVRSVLTFGSEKNWRHRQHGHNDQNVQATGHLFWDDEHLGEGGVQGEFHHLSAQFGQLTRIIQGAQDPKLIHWIQ